jgi:hypothetical protein
VPAFQLNLNYADLPISTLAKYFSSRQPTRSNFEMSSDPFETRCLSNGGAVHLPQSRRLSKPNQAPWRQIAKESRAMGSNMKNLLFRFFVALSLMASVWSSAAYAQKLHSFEHEELEDHR